MDLFDDWYGDRRPQAPSYRLDDPYRVHGDFPGMKESGNLDLTNRPAKTHPDGSVSSVYSTGANVGGEEVLLPGVSERGKMLSPDETVAEYRRTGKHLGKFATPEDSNRYAEALHLQQESNGPDGRIGPQGLRRGEYRDLVTAMLAAK